MNYITYFYSGYCNVLLQHFFIMNDIMHLYSGYFSVFLQRLWLLEDNSAEAGLNVPLFSHLWIWFVNGCNEDRYQERVRSGEREKQIIRRKDRHTDRQTEKFTNDGDLYSTFHPCVFEIDLTIKFFSVCVCVCVCVWQIGPGEQPTAGCTVLADFHDTKFDRISRPNCLRPSLGL